MNVAIIQARLTSRRFPGKVLAELAGKPILRHVIDRVRQAEAVERIIVAAPKAGGGDAIKGHCDEWGAECVVTPHPENDVLARVVAVAESADASLVVRVCGDNPLINPKGIDELLAEAQLAPEADYTGYMAEDGRPMILVPAGCFAEVATLGALRRLNRQLPVASPQREHVTMGIYTDERFVCRWLALPEWYTDNGMPLTAVDRPEDLEDIESWLAENDNKEEWPWK